MPGCGCPIGLTAVATDNLWQGCRHELDYYFDADAAPSTSDMPYNSDYEEAFAEACRMWERKIGVRFRQVALSDRPNFKVDFRYTGRNVLGISYIGGGCSVVGNQYYGAQWDWKKPRFRSTAAHELGHLLGLGHDQCMYNGDPVLMCWQIQANFDEIDGRSVGFLAPHYGPPLEQPDPPPDPPPGDYVTLEHFQRVMAGMAANVTDAQSAVADIYETMTSFRTVEEIQAMIATAGVGTLEDRVHEIIKMYEAHRDGFGGRDIISKLRLTR